MKNTFDEKLLNQILLQRKVLNLNNKNDNENKYWLQSLRDWLPAAENRFISSELFNLRTKIHFLPPFLSFFISLQSLCTAQNVNCRDLEGRHSTPLHFAAGYNRVSVVEYLLHHGADVHAKDKGCDA